MSLFDKFARIGDRHADIEAAGLNPLGVRFDDITSPTEAMADGRSILLAGTHNYLGLTFDEACIEAAVSSIQRHGTGTTGSRIANGTYAGHRALEARLAAFLGREHAMVFPTGYQANLGAIAGLAGPEDVILLDADSHASIYDACKLSGATVIRFRHNSAEDLDRRLSRLEPAVNKLICVEGLYSMLGDTAPLADLVAVKRDHGAYLLVDEAHSLGVFGERGRGVAERDGVEKDVDFVVGTFSKSLGAMGGFCASDHPEFKYMRFASRPYMFTASSAPATVASVLAAVDQVEARPDLKETLWRNARALHRGLTALGLDLGADPSPIISAVMPDAEHAVLFWNRLFANGVYVNLALPPAHSVPLLRCSVSAAHSAAQIERLCAAFETAMQEMAVIGHNRSSALVDGHPSTSSG